MKKLVASVGLVALGASSLQSSASAQELSGPDSSKPWSVSATLRGFYDDNVSTLPNAVKLAPGEHRDAFGFEVSPTASLHWVLQQTTINLGVVYSLLHYDRTPIGSTGPNDQSFTFNGDITHSFSEQLRVRAADGFVIGQEPDMLRAGNAFSTFQRISGDNIRNYGSLSLDAQLTPVLGLSVGYDNAFYDYTAKGWSVGPTVTFTGSPITGLGIVASPAGALNRIENTVHLEGLYTVAPETKVLLGYSFSDVDFNGDELIGGDLIGTTVFFPTFSKDRNYREHRVYVGAQHNFSPQLVGNIRVGASYTDYYNDPNQSASYTPYAVADLKYTYAPESYVDVGFSYDRNATDVVGLLGTGGTGSGMGNFTVDSEAGVVFATINHRITPQLFASVTGQFQNNIYNGGAFNKDNEQYYLAGIDVEYRFNQYLSGHVGYDYDRLQSEIGRTFDRNRVYIGVTASY